MINTVHEDDLAAWYRIPEPVGEISISDFELEDDDDLLLDRLERLPSEGEEFLHVPPEPHSVQDPKCRAAASALAMYFETLEKDGAPAQIVLKISCVQQDRVGPLTLART